MPAIDSGGGTGGDTHAIQGPQQNGHKKARKQQAMLPQPASLPKHRRTRTLNGWTKTSCVANYTTGKDAAKFSNSPQTLKRTSADRQRFGKIL